MRETSNIIEASFKDSKKAVTRSAWVADKGMVLKFLGVKLPAEYEVHFSRSRTEPSKSAIGDKDGVPIPDEYFHDSQRIFAWLYLTPESDIGYTEYEVEIPLNKRPEPSDVEPTPEEENIIDQAISTLNNAVLATAASEANAAASAADAAESASHVSSFVVTTLPLDAIEGQIAISMSTGHPIPYMFINSAWSSMLLFDKPIGYIYISASSTNPGALYGGTWERISGKFLLGATDGGNSGAEQAAGNTGGLAVVTLNESQIPAHTHGSKTLSGSTHFKRHGDSASTTLSVVGGNGGIMSTAQETWTGSHSVIDAGTRTFSNPLWDKLTVTATHEHNSVGGGEYHENMPPYLSVYIWQRTA